MAAFQREETGHKMMIRDVPPEERPRERLLLNGARGLSSSELLAILLRTGNRDESALVLAQRILNRFQELRALVGAKPEELIAIKGIGPAKAVQILAAVELGRRIASTASAERWSIRSPEDAAELMMEEMRHLMKEHFVCLFLNTKNQVIGKEVIFVGSLNSSIIHPREIFKPAIARQCASVIGLHNHPSGDPTPSPEDIEVSKRLVEAGRILGIEFLDHIIIGDKRFVSLKQDGYI
jgi:DNA repair protein RadC